MPEREEEEGVRGRFPSWLHVRLPSLDNFFSTSNEVNKARLATVCQEARCPNRYECWSQSSATFLALGKSCTRSCGFCEIDFNKAPPPLDPGEPERVACAAEALGLRHVVITQVARDDLADGGALQMAEIIRAVKRKLPKARVEVLTSDFSGNTEALNSLLDAHPDVFNHNLETVERLSPRVRHKATYQRSLNLLKQATESGCVSFVKSGMMLGLGETEEEIFAALLDLRKAGVEILTLGQYLQPSRRKLLVKRFVDPKEFAFWKEQAEILGFKKVFSGPFVRSSYHAEEQVSLV